MKAVLLISGGLDSCVAAAWAAKHFGKSVIPINFAYGQRHSRELLASEQICEYFGWERPRTFQLAQPFKLIGGSSLTSGVATGNPSNEAVDRTSDELPSTFVPGRNVIMLAIAGSLAYTEKANWVIGGWNAVDYSGYPDCRPEFLRNAAQTINMGIFGKTEPYDLEADVMFQPSIAPYDGAFGIAAPLVTLTKSQIIEIGIQLSSPLNLTWSCYSGGLDKPCGICDSCKIRAAGFATLGIEDPAL